MLHAPPAGRLDFPEASPEPIMGRKASSHPSPKAPGAPRSGKPARAQAEKASKPARPGAPTAASKPAGKPARTQAEKAGKPARAQPGKATGKPAKPARAEAATAAGKPGKPARAKAAAPAPARAPDVPRLLALLAQTWPEAHVELDHESAYELLVATILSAQSTDKRINQVTPALFSAYPNARSLAGADQVELEEQIRSTGFFRMKAKHLLGMARTVVERHDGEIPRTMDELIALPGVARKTANVVLGSFFGIPSGVVVDTHVQRVARRLGLTEESDPEKIERDLMKAIPRERWIDFAHQLIWHGRRICFSQKPACDICPLAPLCPSAGIGARAVPGDEPGAAEQPEAAGD
jgi:endonuclease-3